MVEAAPINPSDIEGTSEFVNLLQVGGQAKEGLRSGSPKERKEKNEE